MIIDSHCHPHLANKKDMNQIIESFKESGGEYLISIGTDLNTSSQCIQLSEAYPYVKASIGIHPCDIAFDTKTIGTYKGIGDCSEQICTLESLYAKHRKHIVAIGECGLDYHWIESISQKTGTSVEKIKQLQMDYFKSQIHLSKRCNIPFIIHNRDAKNDVIAILKYCKNTNFIVHCFSEDYDFARSCLDFAPNAMMSFSGIVTFKNALSIQDAAQKIPLRNILIETDSPYLTPTPLRGKEENEPAYTKYVLQKICELRPESDEFIKETIYKNSLRVFKLKK